MVSHSRAIWMLMPHDRFFHRLSWTRVARTISGIFDEQLGAVVRHRGIELGPRNRAVDPAPLGRLLRAERPIEQDTSRALRSPTNSDIHCVAPPDGSDPRDGPTWRKTTSSAATARSQAMFSSLPPPTTMPLSRATTGLAQSLIASIASMKRLIQSQ